MGKKQGPRNEEAGGPQRARPAPVAADGRDAADPGWRGFLNRLLFGSLSGLLLRPIAALILGFASVFLVLAWQLGPQPLIAARHYAAFGAHADGRIVESWLALDLDPARVGDHTHWRAFATATPCAVVEYAGDWGAPARRAYCGARLQFNESYTLHDLAEVLPKVPFAWARDERGFAVPELRLARRTRDWLASRKAEDAPGLADPPPQSELEALHIALDRPIDAMIRGRLPREDAFPLVLDPHDPTGALPQAFVDARRQPPGLGSWFFVLLFCAIGLALWSKGMELLLNGLPRAPAVFIGILPLLALPWWADHLPRALSRLDPQVAEVIGDMFADFDPLERLGASTPAEALLAGGERLRWRVGIDSDADTLGRLHFDAPPSPAESADAALAALADAVTNQVRALDADAQLALLQRLREDKLSGRARAGLVFVPAAKQALLDAQNGELQRAAQGFLDEWVTQPIDQPDPAAPGYAERVHLFAILADVPVPEIANRVQWATTH
jgi:hypothetical protein